MYSAAELWFPQGLVQCKFYYVKQLSHRSILGIIVTSFSLFRKITFNFKYCINLHPAKKHDSHTRTDALNKRTILKTSESHLSWCTQYLPLVKKPAKKKLLWRGVSSSAIASWYRVLTWGLLNVVDINLHNPQPIWALDEQAGLIVGENWLIWSYDWAKWRKGLKRKFKSQMQQNTPLHPTLTQSSLWAFEFSVSRKQSENFLPSFCSLREKPLIDILTIVWMQTHWIHDK